MTLLKYFPVLTAISVGNHLVLYRLVGFESSQHMRSRLGLLMHLISLLSFVIDFPSQRVPKKKKRKYCKK